MFSRTFSSRCTTLFFAAVCVFFFEQMKIMHYFLFRFILFKEISTCELFQATRTPADVEGPRNGHCMFARKN